MSKRLIRDVLILLYGLAYLGVGMDAYRNPVKFERLVLFGPELLVFLALLVNILARLKSEVILPKVVTRLNLLFFPIVSLVTVVLSVWTYFSPDNLVYSKTMLNLPSLMELSILSGLMVLINASNSWWKKYYRQVIFVIPIVMVFVGIVMALWKNKFFWLFNREDHEVEYFQFIFLVFSVLTLLAIIIRHFRIKRLVDRFIIILSFLVIGIAGLAGEEISWGQRILNVTTPEYLSQINIQNETNVHNIRFFWNITNMGYILVGLYGSIGWMVLKFQFLRWWKILNLVIVPWFVASFFVPILLYNVFLPSHIPHVFEEWFEYSELMLYMGMFLMITLGYLKVQNNREYRDI